MRNRRKRLHSAIVDNPHQHALFINATDVPRDFDKLSSFHVKLQFKWCLVTCVRQYTVQCFLNIQRDHFMPVVRSFYVISGCTSFNDLCSKYGIADVHRSVFCKHAWNVFISSISF